MFTMVYAGLLYKSLLLAPLQLFIILIDNKLYAKFTYRLMQLEMLKNGNRNNTMS